MSRHKALHLWEDLGGLFEEFARLCFEIVDVEEVLWVVVYRIHKQIVDTIGRSEVRNTQRSRNAGPGENDDIL